MRTLRLLAILGMATVAAYFSACFQEPEGGSFGLEAVNTELCDACLKAAPDPDSLEVTIPEADGKAGRGDWPKSLGQLPVYYDLTVDISRGLNHWILGQLGFLDEILTYPPTQSDDNTCTWGPFIPSGLSPVEAQFEMTQVSDTQFDYTWSHRPKNTDGEFTAVWGGEITPATDTARRGVGNLYMDFTALQGLDPTWDASGRFDVDYDTYTDGRRIDIEFTDFVGEDSGYPSTGTYHYHNHADNSGEFSYIFDVEIDGGNSSEPERASVVTQWEPTGAGTSEFAASGGDIGSDDTFGSNVTEIGGLECWDELFGRTYYRIEVRFESGDPLKLEEEGSEGDCPVFG